jgi:hypothetical protein
MNRLQEKYTLFTKLGALLGPLQRLVDHPEQFDEQESARVIARYCDEHQRLANEMNVFSKGEPGHDYLIQYSHFFTALHEIRLGLQNNKKLEDLLPVSSAKAQAAIDSIPVHSPSVILDAGSPFTAYCRLRELCEVDATCSLVWLDPYLDYSLFHRYLQHVRLTATITIVTCEPHTNARPRDHQRWAAFLDISRLFASERTHSTYRLVVQKSLHDRWLMLDEKRIYNLGGSAKDAATRDDFTISTVDSTSVNLAAIARNLNAGTELFGPSTPNHA